MKRNEYVKFCHSKHSDGVKKTNYPMASVTDPTFAQTGRQMLTNPLPINYRVQYQDGAPLNPDNPHQFNEFDKMYPDTFKAMTEAKQQITTTKDSVKKAHEQYQQQQQNQQQL